MSRMCVIKPVFISKDKDFTLYNGDSLKILKDFEESFVDMIFADPPYFLSNGGNTWKSSKSASVNKGKWDKSKGIAIDNEFNFNWIKECNRVLRENGTIWVSGTFHNIYSVGLNLQILGFRILNNITWEKPNPPPNFGCRCFTHSTETILWAAKSAKSKYFFNYKAMKEINSKQMKDVWRISPPKKDEKKFGKHPTQKPEALLDRIIVASTQPGDLILDPFCGSGTTIISATKVGRKSIGIDMEKEYCDLTIKRFMVVENEKKR